MHELDTWGTLSLQVLKLILQLSKVDSPQDPLSRSPKSFCLLNSKPALPHIIAQLFELETVFSLALIRETLWMIKERNLIELVTTACQD